MNAAVVNIVLWGLTLGVAGGAVWYHQQPRETPTLPDKDLRLIDRHRQAQDDVPLVDKKDYEHVNDMPWVTVKPPPEKTTVVVDNSPKSPFILTRVINESIVELTSLADNNKKVYRVGDEIKVRQGTSSQVVGKVLELDRQEGLDVLAIDYQGTEFKLELETGQDQLYTRLTRLTNRYKLNVTEPNKLLEHEGKETAPNSYELNADFFNAIIDNSVQEIAKIKFDRDAQGNFLITELAENSVLRKFGFKERDVLLAFNGERVKEMGDVRGFYEKWVSSGSSEAKLRVMRAGKAVDVSFGINTKNLGQYKDHYK